MKTISFVVVLSSLLLFGCEKSENPASVDLPKVEELDTPIVLVPGDSSSAIVLTHDSVSIKMLSGYSDSLGRPHETWEIKNLCSAPLDSVGVRYNSSGSVAIHHVGTLAAGQTVSFTIQANATPITYWKTPDCFGVFYVSGHLDANNHPVVIFHITNISAFILANAAISYDTYEGAIVKKVTLNLGRMLPEQVIELTIQANVPPVMYLAW